MICNTENFILILVPGLSSSSSASSSISKTLSRQESHSSSSSSSSSSSPTVGEIQVREREDATKSDISPVPMSNFLDDGSGQPEEIQANKKPKITKRPRLNGETCVTILRFGRRSHSMDPGVSVQKQNFTRNPVKLAEVPGTRKETKSHLH